MDCTQGAGRTIHESCRRGAWGTAPRFPAEVCVGPPGLGAPSRQALRPPIANPATVYYIARMWTVLLTLAFAAEPAPDGAGFYHPNDIAQASERMAEATEKLTGVVEERSRSLRRLAIALQEYRESLELLAVRAPAEEWARLGELETRYHREEAALQGFADDMVTNFDQAMVDAMERALEPHEGAVRCEANIPVQGGPRVPGMARTTQNPDCTGENLNEAIATAMDADEELGAALGDILGREWPEVTLEPEPVAPVGEGMDRYVSVRGLVSAVAGKRLKAIAAEDDRMREEIQAALEQDDPDTNALRTRVAEIEQVTADARGDLGKTVFDVASWRMERWKNGEGFVGWCAAPELLGGCEGTEVTSEVVGRLQGDKKFGKKLSKALAD